MFKAKFLQIEILSRGMASNGSSLVVDQQSARALERDAFLDITEV